MTHFITSSSQITDVAITVPNITGGTNGRVVRINGTNTATDASQGDSTGQLNNVLIKMNDVYYGYGVVDGFTGLTPGSLYYLSTLGNITAAPPIPSASVRLLALGFALNTTTLFFKPGIPISGN